MQKIIRLNEPYPFSSEICYKVTGGQRNCDVVKNHLYSICEQHNIDVKGNERKWSVQLHPDRRAALQLFYAALEHCRQHLHADKFGFSMRNLEIYVDDADGARIGKHNRTTKQWDWDTSTCTQLALSPMCLRCLGSLLTTPSYWTSVRY